MDNWITIVTDKLNTRCVSSTLNTLFKRFLSPPPPPPPGGGGGLDTEGAVEGIEVACYTKCVQIFNHAVQDVYIQRSQGHHSPDRGVHSI